MNILIRADSSSTLGLGHIKRDLVLAQHYPSDHILFACQDLPGHIIASIPYPVHILHSHDPEELITLITHQLIDLVIFDHYGIDEAYEKAIKDRCNVTILSFDDTYQRHHCDILLNHNISADPQRYKGLVPDHCELRCGKAYTLIREEFKTEKGLKPEKIYDLFIALGGTDPTNTTLTVLKTLDPNNRVCVVTTSGNPHLQALQNYIKDHPSIVLHLDSHEVARLMNMSRCAIVTPSVMVHEVLYLNIPFVAIQTAPNQQDMADYLQKEGLIVMKHWSHDALAPLLNP